MNAAKMKTALIVLSVVTGLCVIGLSVVGYATFRGNSVRLNDTDLEKLTSSPQMAKAVDDGIARFIAKQQEDERQAQEDARKKNDEKAANVKRLQGYDYVYGDRNAEILLIEYSDFECPFCEKFHPTAKQAVDESGGKVAWVYRYYPLSIHAGAQKKAEAGECVGKLGGERAFWKFAEDIFAKGTNFPVTNLSELAVAAGVSQGQFENCLNSGEAAERVQTDMQEGLAAGITGTPGVILLNVKTGKTRVIPGAVPLNVVQAGIAEVSK